MEAEERGLNATVGAPGQAKKIWDHTRFRAPRIAKTVIRSFAWIPLPKPFPTTSPP